MAKSPFHPFHFEITKKIKEELEEYDTSDLDDKVIQDLLVTDEDGNLVFSKDKWEKANRDELKEQYTDDVAAFFNKYSAEQAANILNSYQDIKRNSPELLDTFSTLYGIYESISTQSFARYGDENQLDIVIKTGKDGNRLPMLTMKNLGGLGLNFTIENGRSILFDNNKPLTQAQVEAFYNFFKDQKFHISDFKGLEDIKVVDNNDPDKEIGSFEELYLAHLEANLDELTYEELAVLADRQKDNPAVQKAWQDRLAEEEANGGDKTGSLLNMEPETSGRYAEYIDKYFNNVTPNFTMRGFKNAIYARAGIMRIDKRCMTTRRLADGSLAICFYASESDLRKDGTMDKEDVVRHTKKCMFVAHPGKPPVLGLYIPQGGKMETGYAKAMVGALKKQGYPYIKIPSAKDMGGDVFESLMKAFGDQLAIPVGADLGADHLDVLIKAAEGSNSQGPQKADDTDLILWKMALVERLDEQLAKSPNSQVQGVRDRLESDVRLQQFKSNYLSKLEAYIQAGADAKYGDKWSKLDVAAAKESLAKVIDAVRTGEYVNPQGETVKLNFDYLCKDHAKAAQNEAVLIELFEQGIKEAYPQLVKDFDKKVHDNIASGNTEVTTSEDPIKANAKDAALNMIVKQATQHLDTAVKEAGKANSQFAKMDFKNVDAFGDLPSMPTKRNARGQITHYDTSVLLRHPTPLKSTPRTGGNERGGRSGGRE